MERLCVIHDRGSPSMLQEWRSTGCPNLLRGDLGTGQEPVPTSHLGLGEPPSVETTSLSMPGSWTVPKWDRVPVTSRGSVAPFPAPTSNGPSDLPTTYCSLSAVGEVRLVPPSFQWAPHPITWQHEVCSHSSVLQKATLTCPCPHLMLPCDGGGR